MVRNTRPDEDSDVAHHTRSATAFVTLRERVKSLLYLENHFPFWSIFNVWQCDALYSQKHRTLDSVAENKESKKKGIKGHLLFTRLKKKNSL